jgi:multiple sugar transport system permease protein
MAASEAGNLSSSRGLGTVFREWREGTGERKRNNPLGYLFIAPAIILYLVFNIWPIIRGFLMAFTDYRFVYPDTRWAWNGFENFTKMLDDKKVTDSLAVSLKYTAIVLPIVIIIALLLAVLISRVRTRSNFYRWVVYLPSILPVAVSFLMFREMYGAKFGFINTVLRNFGVANPPEWLLEVNSALPAIGAAHIWIIFGFPTLLFLIGIYNIGEEMYEAAALDGANEWQKFRWLTVPLLKPTLAMVLILVLPGLLSVTDPMLILTQGGPQDSTRTLGLRLYQVAFQQGDLRLGYASAISLTMSLAVSVVVGVIFWWSREKN